MTTLLGIRRYPVKALTGEDLDAVEVDARGLAGDRWWAVVDDEGRLAAHKDSRRFRRRDGVERFGSRTSDDGLVLVGDGRREWAVGDPELDSALTTALGAPVRVDAEDGTPHQDSGSVSLVGTASLRWCAERWGVDAHPRRLRVNLLVGTDEPFVEETWVGRDLAVGGVVLRARERVERCRTVDLAQDGLPEGSRWLKHLGRERDLSLAVYADVVAPGTLRVGDTVVPG